ncbi:hypothetical protein H5J22_11130 [Cetobacterium sp. 8H]|uniref:hypothetical protein n=1 Tax=Cetobacterium sp. 8H TaxID=2759681 RepID=UPI00163BAA9B|nr:hypothetical protein [Cetobacterium sp. 8H]MBC2851950.1 hypothetical protein [Cetobacterium sp. 8H]
MGVELELSFKDLLTKNKLSEYKTRNERVSLFKNNFIVDLKEKSEEDKIIISESFFNKIPLGIIPRENQSKLKVKVFNKANTTNDYLKKNINVVIVLESPHKDEYDKNMNPKAPAQGTTGRNLFGMKRKIKRLLNLIYNTKENYNFIIINPVPYQTSLHYLYVNEPKELNKKLRDKVWYKLWKDERIDCQNEFISELKSLNPKYILNCCTKKFKKEINEKLRKGMDKKIKYKILQLPHPCTDAFVESLKCGVNFLNIKANHKN